MYSENLPRCFLTPPVMLPTHTPDTQVTYETRNRPQDFSFLFGANPVNYSDFLALGWHCELNDQKNTISCLAIFSVSLLVWALACSVELEAVGLEYQYGPQNIRFQCMALPSLLFPLLLGTVHTHT